MICNRAIDVGSRNDSPELSKAFLRKHLPDVFIES